MTTSLNGRSYNPADVVDRYYMFLAATPSIFPEIEGSVEQRYETIPLKVSQPEIPESKNAAMNCGHGGHKNKVCSDLLCFKSFFRSLQAFSYADQFVCSTTGETPRFVLAGSKTRVTLQCRDCPHKFTSDCNTLTSNRFVGSNRCPYCHNKELCSDDKCNICFQHSVASHPDAGQWSDKNVKTARQVMKGSNADYIFDCSECGEEYRMSAYEFTDNIGTKCCKRSSLSQEDPKADSAVIILDDSPSDVKDQSHRTIETVSEVKEIVLIDDRGMSESKYQVTKGTGMFSDCPSFAYVDPNKNHDINVYKLKQGSGKYVSFKCLVCGFEYIAQPYALRTYSATKEGLPHCTHCSGYTRCNQTSCIVCAEMSYNTHPYSKNCLDNPNDYKSGWTGKLKHKCPDCSHIFEMTPRDITVRGRRCPYCSSRKRCDPSIECKSCLINSAASNTFASQFDDPNPEHQLRLLYKNDTSKNIRWKCDFCGDHFYATCNARKRNPFGGCSSCRNKTERIVYEYLNTFLNGDVKQGTKYNWCKSKKTGRYLPFDLVIEKFKLIIEVDGEQHFKSVKAWRVDRHSQHRNDVHKMFQAYSNGYSVIRIQQTDVFYDSIQWKDLLKNAIKMYNEPTLILLGDEDSLLKKAYTGYQYGQLEHELSKE